MKSTTNDPADCLRHLRVVLLLSALVILFATASPTTAESAVHESGCTTPRTDGAGITLVIEQQRGTPFRVVIGERQPVIYRDRSTGRHLAFVARVVDAAGGDLDIDVYELVDDRRAPAGFVVRDRLDSMRVKAGFTSFVRIAETLRIEVTDLATGTHHSTAGSSEIALDDPGDLLLPSPGGGPCCLSCGNITVCGCSVSGSCGSCTGDC